MHICVLSSHQTKKSLLFTRKVYLASCALSCIILYMLQPFVIKLPQGFNLIAKVVEHGCVVGTHHEFETWLLNQVFYASGDR